MAGRLKDKVAVVTGAAPRGEGIGNGMATAVMFAREGAKVVLVNRSAERADKLAQLTFIGHSHLQRAFQLLPTVKDVFDERLRIEDGNRYLCSIGSCGQPRDYDPRACYGIWDDADKVVEFRRVPYDAEKSAPPRSPGLSRNRQTGCGGSA